MKKALLTATLLSIGAYSASAQQFVNGDLDGTISGFSDLPTGWQAIDDNDWFCNANTSTGATPDLTGPQGPDSIGGIAGQAFSGSTFVSGLDASVMNWDFHEGIQQELTGLVPNVAYHIHFYQAVVKQQDHLDQSGSWSVYLDDDFVETSAPTTSTLAHNDQNLEWEARVVAFVPYNTTHTIKFIPEDDDLDASSGTPLGGLRMGIDKISLVIPKGIDSENAAIPFTLFPNPTQGVVALEFEDLTDEINVEVLDVCGKLISKGSYNQTQRVMIDIDGTPGIYFVRVIYPDGTLHTVKVNKM